MSLFNVNYRNEIDIRSNDAYSEKLFTINPLNGNMERVLPGGGGGSGDTPYTPPYWVQSQSANIYDKNMKNNPVRCHDNILTFSTKLSSRSLPCSRFYGRASPCELGHSGTLVLGIFLINLIF